VERVTLDRNASRSIGKRRFDLRGNVLTSEFFSSPDTVFCPACLQEDDLGAKSVACRRAGRLMWTLRPVRTCAKHNLALIHRDKQRWDDKFHELAVRVPERSGRLQGLTEGCQQRSPSALQGYVAARLDGVTGPSWLDSQTLEQAVRTTEMLGLLVEFGPSAKLSEVSHEGWDRAGHVGYDITSAGETGIRDLLLSVSSEFRGKGGKPGRRKIFGATYEWLSGARNSKETGDISRILREHIFDTMEIAAGETILGEQLTHRRLHSVASLSAESGLDARTLRNVLAASGLIPAEEKVSRHHLFDAQAGRDLAASVTRMTHVIALPKALNSTRPQSEQLLDERLLRQISERWGQAAGRTWKAVDDREIARFLSTMKACANPVDILPAGLVPISKAAEKAKASCVEIMHLVLGGFLSSVVRREDIEGYAAVHVDPDEVRTRIDACMPGLSASAAFARLKIPKSTGWALVDRDDEFRLEPLVIEGRSGTHRYYRFREEVVAAFEAKFTTAARVANHHDVRVASAFSHFKRNGISPVLRRKEIGIDLYRASEVQELEMT